MKLRRLEERDIDTIIKHEELYLGSSLGRNQFEIELKNEYAYFIVSEIENKIVGYISSTLEEYGEILNFFVVSEYRNQGIGKTLLNSVIEEAKKNKIKSLYLEVSEKNENAINLYKSFDFKVSHIRKNYYKDSDAYVLIKEFN